jgi:nitrate reductase NapE component
VAGRVVAFLTEFRRGTIQLVWVCGLIACGVVLLGGSLAFVLWALDMVAGPARMGPPLPEPTVSVAPVEPGGR